MGQVHFMLAYGVGAPGPDAYPVMEVMCALLGGGMGSRLYGALRANAALAYETNAYYYALSAGGYLAAYAGAAPAQLERTKRLLVGEFERLRREPVGMAELGRAQRFAIGADALAHQRIKDRAFRLAWYEAIGLGFGFDEGYAGAIAAVTAEQIQAAARRWFDHYSLGLVVPRE
jgi:zinc protease